MSDWVVVGKGALGLLAASRWALRQIPSSLFPRNNPSSKTALQFNFREYDSDTIHSLKLRLIDREILCPRSIKKVLIPVKAFDAVQAFVDIAPYLADDASIVLCHNGMGPIDIILNKLSSHQSLWFASTSHGAFKPDVDSVIHTGKGETIFGPLNPAAREVALSFPFLLCDQMEASLGPVSVVSDIHPYLLRKLAVNAAINTLTALFNVPNGSLLWPHLVEGVPRSRDNIRPFLHNFKLSHCEDSFENICGLRTFPEMIRAITIEISEVMGYADLNADNLEASVYRVINQTKANFSSMHQDIKLGRRCEIDEITGYILRKANECNLQLPVNAAVYDSVKRLDECRRRT